MARYFSDQPVLARIGALSLVCALVLVPVILVDPTEVLGINRWIKPIKFFASIAVFVWTIAVYLSVLPGHETFKRRIGWSMAAIFTVEMAAIVMQSLRGVPSHFNFSTPVDGFVFGVMGVAIVINTLLVAWILILFLRENPQLPPAIVVGLRLGLFVFVAASIQGGYMSSRPGHAVGVADGGPGIPFLNWSTIAGDLRVAHFLGLHSIQAIPLFAVFADRIAPSASKILVWLFAIAYVTAFLFVLAQALNGRPFLSESML